MDSWGFVTGTWQDVESIHMYFVVNFHGFDAVGEWRREWEKEEGYLIKK